MEETQNLYWEETRNDGQALQAYLENIYSKTNPFLYKYPMLEELNFWKFSGLKTSIFVFQAIGATILSGVRTGGLFFIIELKLLEKFGFTGFWAEFTGFIVMIAALFAFEGFLLGRGFSDGEKSTKINESFLGLLISTVVVVGGGIFSGLGITSVPKEIDLWINTIIAIITGMGAAGMTFFGAENIGFALNKFNKKKEELKKIYDEKEKEYNELLTIWQQEGAEEFHKSKYNNRRKDSIYVQKTFKNENIQTENENLVQNNFKVEQKISKNEQCRNMIENFVSQQGRLPKIEEIISNTNFSGGLASTCLQEFIYSHGIELLDKGLITQKKYDEINKKFDIVEEETTEQPQEENKDEW